MIQDQPPEEHVQWEMPERRRPRRIEEETEDVGFPIVWVLIGGLAALLTIGLVALGLVRLFTRPVTTAATTPTPAVAESVRTEGVETPAVVLETSAPTEEARLVPTFTPTIALPTPTPIPPTPTPPLPTLTPTLPTEIRVGGYVRVVNTEGAGLSLRAGPARSTARLVVAAENTVLPVLDGPQDDQDGERDETGALYQWWYLRNTDGSEGWGRADFLEPAPPPE
ncbi:MAG: SH3 domain-containing protein [Anaerolineae bacterium]